MAVPRRVAARGKDAALLLSLLLLVVLTGQKRQLGARLDEHRERAEWPYPGFVVPTFLSTTLSGDSVVLGDPAVGESQVLLVFTTTCGYCRQSLPHWQRLSTEVKSESGGKAGVYGLSLDPEDSTRAYAIQHGLEFPIALMSDPRMKTLYRLQGVPLILIIESGGLVTHVHKGTLGQTAEVIEPQLAKVIAAAVR